MSNGISGNAGEIFTRVSKCFINCTFVWQSLKGCCQCIQFKKKNRRFWRNNLYRICFVHDNYKLLFWTFNSRRTDSTFDSTDSHNDDNGLDWKRDL